MPLTPARRPFARTPLTGALAAWVDKMLSAVERAQLPQAVKLVDDDYAVTTSDQTIAVDASAGPVSILFSAPERVAYGIWTVKKVDASANAVTLVATIDGVTDPDITTQWGAMTVQSDGLQYLKIATVP